MSKRKTLTLAQLTENSNKLWVALAQLEAKQGGRFKAVEESNGRLSRIMEAQNERIEALEARLEDAPAPSLIWTPLSKAVKLPALKAEPPKCPKCKMPTTYSQSEGGWVCENSMCNELHVDAPAPSLRERMQRALVATGDAWFTAEYAARICAAVAEEGR